MRPTPNPDVIVVGAGHTVLTVAAGRVAPAAGGPGQMQVLVTASETEPATPVADYFAKVRS
jgi:hypothetical protein